MSNLSPEQRIVQRIDALFIVHGWDRSAGGVQKDGCTHYEKSGLFAVLNPLRFLVTFRTGSYQMLYGLTKQQAEVEQFIETGDRPLTPSTHFQLFTSKSQQKGIQLSVNRDYGIELVVQQLPVDADPVQLTVEDLRAIRQEITGVIVYIEESQRLEP